MKMFLIEWAFFITAVVITILGHSKRDNPYHPAYQFFFGIFLLIVWFFVFVLDCINQVC